MARKRKYDKPQWTLVRERLRLTDPEPPAQESEWSIRGAVVNLFKTLDEQKSPLIQQIRAKWDIIAGDSVAGHSFPGRLNDNVLYVYVDSSAWLNEIVRFHSVNIMRRIQKEAGETAVRQVRYQVNPKQSRKISG